MADEKGYDFGNICRHCDYETPQPVSCVVTGVVPQWLEGSFIYNGPGITKIGETSYQHCFDSAAILQRITVTGGSATYLSRFLRSETYKTNMKAGTIAVGEFGTAPVVPEQQRGFMAKLRRITDVEKMLSDNTVVSVATVAGKLYAMGETPFMQELCLRTLDIRDRQSLYRHLGLITQTPHPVEDAAGNAYTVGPTVTITGSKYNIVKFPADGSPPLVLARLAPRWRLSPSYMHSLGITENYIVILEMPLAMSVTEVFSDMFNNMAVIDGMKWHQDNVLLHVVELRTGKVLRRRYSTEAMFMLHIANCYEDTAGNIVMDFPCYRDAAMLHDMFINKLREEKGADNRAFCERFRTRVTRLVLPVDGGDREVTVAPVTLSTSASFENPVVSPLYLRRQHRYIYGMGVCPGGGNRGQVTKLDVETGEVKLFMEDELYIADPTFVPRPSAVDEDDGTLVVPCVRCSDPRYGCLVLLDARTMTEVGRVSYTARGVVPMPMHGIFVPSTDM